jgi:hypothetical protein
MRTRPGEENLNRCPGCAELGTAGLICLRCGALIPKRTTLVPQRDLAGGVPMYVAGRVTLRGAEAQAMLEERYGDDGPD